jgi:hypothetical protein
MLSVTATCFSMTLHFCFNCLNVKLSTSTKKSFIKLVPGGTSPWEPVVVVIKLFTTVIYKLL